MTFKQAVKKLSRDDRFKATTATLTTLLMKKGFITNEEFEAHFCQWAEKNLKAKS